MNEAMEKPALGPKPYFLAHEERIGELAQAIVRQTQRSGSLSVSEISTWAFEIQRLTELIIELKEKNERIGGNRR